MARVHSLEAELRLARFHNDDAVNATMQMSLLMRLGRTPTRELVEHLQDAVEAKNPARAEAVRLEFESRDGELTALGPEARAEARRNSNAIFSKLELPNARRRSGPSAGSRRSLPWVRSASPPLRRGGPT